MKKFLMIPVLGLLAAGSAFAALNSVTDLNAAIEKILQPYQNAQTEATMVINSAELGAERVLSAGLSAFYKKSGDKDTLIVNITNLGYTYGDGSAPTTNLAGTVQLDLSKVIPQDQFNEIIGNIDEAIAGLKENYAAEYGESLTITPVITERTKDDAGNFTGLAGTINFSFDFSKLPEGVKLENIYITGGTVKFALNLKTGLALDVTVLSNTASKEFTDETAGLKVIVEKLLAQDAQYMADINQYFQQLEQMADGIVNEKAFN